MVKSDVMNGFDGETADQLLAGTRGKRQRMDEPSKALARALLETVRQALDDDADGGPDGDVLTAAAHDQDPVAYVRVDGGQRHEAGTAKRGRKWTAQSGPVEDPRQMLVYAAPRPPGFKSAWMHDPAIGAPPLEQQEALVAAAAAAAAGAAAHAYHPHHAETPSHGSTHTNVEAASGWEMGVGMDVGGGGSADLAEYGVVDRPDQTSTDDGNEGPVHRKKNGSPKAGIPGGPCAHCGTTESPQWRRPLTKKVVLCNACGIYFSRHHSLPKRKKLAGGNPNAAQRSAKAVAAHAPHVKQQAPLGPAGGGPSIMCEEELEMEEDGCAAPSMALGTAYGADPMGVAQHAPRVRVGEAVPPGSAPWNPQMVPMEGLPAKAPQPARERVALSLPLMTAFPVVGGINAVVQTFLNPSAAGC